MSIEELLTGFLIWYDPEAEHKDIEPYDVVMQYLEDMSGRQ